MLPYDSLTYYDSFSYERNWDLRDFLGSTFITDLLEEVNRRCILVLWGDGTMLRAIGNHHDKDIPFLWINFGHKGFLLNHPEWVYPEISEFSSRDYPLLEIVINWIKIGTAFNDVNIYSPEAKAISLSVSNGVWELDLWWDGMILATPAWLTWHSKSYWWPILPHKSENLVITPKGNIESQSPKALDDAHTIRITNTGRKFPIAVNIDGSQEYTSEANENVQLEIKKSRQTVSLLISQNHIQDWDNKVIREQGFRV